MNIALTNRNPHSQYQRVHINVKTKICTFSGGREVALKHLPLEFSHPLLTEKWSPAADHVYHYEYDRVDELLYSAIYVYSTLLQVENPQACQFKINPSAKFQRAQFAKNIYFSIDRQKIAQKMIAISQLNELVDHLCDYSFEFSEDMIIDDQFTIADLPAVIDGDALYKSDDRLIDLLKSPHTFERYELRYLDSEIGFGVFSRSCINKGEIIALYSGLKTVQPPPNLAYAFKNNLDCLDMYLDARTQGNITRFINHAPKNNSRQACFIESNVESKIHVINGIEMILYQACKDVLPGEQLLVDYGKNFFEHIQVSMFKKNGKSIDLNRKFFRRSAQKKLAHIRIMANLEIKEAQQYLWLRMVVIVMTIIGLMSLINYW